jgi:hypothetical protein
MWAGEIVAYRGSQRHRPVYLSVCLGVWRDLQENLPGGAAVPDVENFTFHRI